jgi:uncharacterized protein YggE
MNFSNPFLSAALAVSVVSVSAVDVRAQQVQPSPRISVSATGTSSIAPDMAILNLSVLRRAETAREALNANSEAMAQVLAAMKEAGVEDRDLQTSNFNISPEYHYPKRASSGEQKPPKIVGYTVSNSLTVRIRNLEELGTILDRSVSLGVNNGGNVQFTNSNSDAPVEEARKNAMQRAIAKAKTLTSEAGVGLGKIVMISEQNRGRPRPKAFARTARLEAASDAVPIASGENSYSVTVNVTWELQQ